MPNLDHLSPEKRAEVEAIYAKMFASLPYERTEVPGASLTVELQRFRTLGKGYPVAIGDDDALSRIAEQYSIDDPAVFPRTAITSNLPHPRSLDEILAASDALQFPDDLAQWPGACAPEDLQASIGEWPDQPADNESNSPILAVAYDFRTGMPFEKVHVLFIPTEESWQVPAYLRWGDWNACPPPEYHVAALRHWHDAYGAELVGISGDTMDLMVKYPPTSKEEALAVAKDIYWYCPDDVDQGTETLAALAGSMVMRHNWQFWWD